MKLSPEQERERLARWLRDGEVYDPRNDEDYDTFEYGTEPLPHDATWTQVKEKTPLETISACSETTQLLPLDSADH